MSAPIRRGTARRLGIRRARRGPDAYRVLVDEVDLTAFVQALKLPLDDWQAHALYHVTTPGGPSVVEGIYDRYRRAGFDARFTWNDTTWRAALGAWDALDEVVEAESDARDPRPSESDGWADW